MKIDASALRRSSIAKVGAALLALIAALLLAQRLRAVSHRYDHFDFLVFYGWWTDYSGGGNPWTDQRGPMLGCNYTPAFIEIFSPLAHVQQKTAFWLWQGAQVLCMAAAMLLLALGGDSPLKIVPTIVVLSLVLISRPFSAALSWSQIAPMLLALLCGAWYCARRNRPAIAGLWLALAALLKVFPAGVAGYFLFARNWRALAWTVAFFAVGVMATNPAHWIELVTNGLPISYRITGHGGLTVLAFVRQCVAHFSGTRGAGEPFFAVWGFTALFDFALLAIAIALTTTGRARSDLDGLLFGLWVALAILLSPLAWSQDILLLLPACVFGILAAWDGYEVAEPSGTAALLAGAAMLSVCVVTSLIKAVPHPGFLIVLITYLGAALIFRARTRQQLP